MILSNFASLSTAKLAANTSTPAARKPDGTNATAGGSVSQNYSVTRIWNVYGSGYDSTRIVLGDSDTPVDIDDYCLGNDITSSLSFISGTVNPNRSVRKDFPTVIAVFKNNTANAITVKEVGLMTGWYENASVNGQVLIARKIITPLTIQPGESYSFAYSMSLE